MKKFLLFFCALLAIISISKKDLQSFTDRFDGEYSAYVTEGEGVPVFSVEGKGVYETSSVSKNNTVGETIVLADCDLSVDDLLFKLGAVYHFSSDIEDIKIIYGYSPWLKRTTFMGFKPVNFQITVTENEITISNPVNLGSY